MGFFGKATYNSRIEELAERYEDACVPFPIGTFLKHGSSSIDGSVVMTILGGLAWHILLLLGPEDGMIWLIICMIVFGAIESFIRDAVDGISVDNIMSLREQS